MVAGARIRCAEFPLVAGTNLLGKVGQHKFTKGITDGTVRTGDVVTMAPTTRVLTQATATNKICGVVVYRTTYNWGATTPARFTALPANIEVDVCFDGPIEANSDVSASTTSCISARRLTATPLALWNAPLLLAIFHSGISSTCVLATRARGRVGQTAIRSGSWYGSVGQRSHR